MTPLVQIAVLILGFILLNWIWRIPDNYGTSSVSERTRFL